MFEIRYRWDNNGNPLVYFVGVAPIECKLPEQAARWARQRQGWPAGKFPKKNPDQVIATSLESDIDSSFEFDNIPGKLY